MASVGRGRSGIGSGFVGSLAHPVINSAEVRAKSGAVAYRAVITEYLCDGSGERGPGVQFVEGNIALPSDILQKRGDLRGLPAFFLGLGRGDRQLVAGLLDLGLQDLELRGVVAPGVYYKARVKRAGHQCC